MVKYNFLARIKGVDGLITGNITCQGGTPFDIRHEFEVLGSIPIEANLRIFP